MRVAWSRLVVAGAACLLVFAVLLVLVQVDWAPLRDADLSSSNNLHDYALAHHGFVDAMTVVSAIGSGWDSGPVLAAVVVWLLWRRRVQLALLVAATAALSSLLNQAVKAAVGRPRPAFADPVETAAGYSFPSGHAQGVAVFVGLLLLVFLPRVPRAARIPLAVAGAAWVAVVGFSRIALGVHYLSDVLAGYALAAAWLATMTLAFVALPLRRAASPPAR